MNLVIPLCINKIPCRLKKKCTFTKFWTVLIWEMRVGVGFKYCCPHSSFIFILKLETYTSVINFFQVHSAATRWLSRYA